MIEIHREREVYAQAGGVRKIDGCTNEDVQINKDMLMLRKKERERKRERDITTAKIVNRLTIECKNISIFASKCYRWKNKIEAQNQQIHKNVIK